MGTLCCEDARQQLQMAVGETPVVTAESFTNVMRTQHINYVLAVRPQTLDEVQRVVRAASLSGLRVRPIGGSFSWSPLYPDEGQVALYTSHLTRHDGPRMELTQVHPGHYELRALCNVTTGELLQFQLQHNVELPSNVIFSTATVAGIMCTTSHGTGTEIAQSVGDHVVRMRVIDGSGNLRCFDVMSDPDIMKAARGSLGLFGVIYDVTFRVKPGTIDIATDNWLPVRDVLYNTEYLKQLVFNNDSLELFWFPMSSLSYRQALKVLFRKRLHHGEWNPGDDSVWVRTVTAAPPGATLKGRKTGTVQSPLENWEYTLGRSLVRRAPSVVPLMSLRGRDGFRELFCGSVVQEHAHAVHFLKGLDTYQVWEMEFAMDLDLDCHCIMLAMDDLKEQLMTNGLQGRFPLSLLVEMRVTRASDLYMAPGHIGHCTNGGSGHAVHLEFVSLAKTPHFFTFATQIALRWMSKFRARPHWGKQWSFVPNIHTYLQQTLSREFSLFRQALERSNIDPCRTFFNSTLECLIYSGVPLQHLGSSCSQCVQPIAAKPCHGHPLQPCCQDHRHSHTQGTVPHPQPCSHHPHGQMPLMKKPNLLQGRTEKHPMKLVVQAKPTNTLADAPVGNIVLDKGSTNIVVEQIATSIPIEDPANLIVGYQPEGLVVGNANAGIVVGSDQPTVLVSAVEPVYQSSSPIVYAAP